MAFSVIQTIALLCLIFTLNMGLAIANASKSLKIDKSVIKSGDIMQNLVASITPQQQYISDEDFVIPTAREQPRYIQRYMNKVKSIRPNDVSFCKTNSHSETTMVLISLAVLSFSKAVHRTLTNNKHIKFTILQRVENLRNTIFHPCKGPATTIINSDADDDIDDNIESSVPRNTTGTFEERVKIETSSVDDSDSSSRIDWKSKYDDLIIETAELQQQLFNMTQTLQQLEMQSISSEDSNHNEKENAVDVQSLHGTIRYWKRVAQMNEQEVSNIVKTERQSSINQLEQLKSEMLRVVEQERSTMYNEFHSMVQELRGSLIGTGSAI
jgi:hypothetical protein